MRHMRTILVVLLLVFPFTLFAQEDLDSVISAKEARILALEAEKEQLQKELEDLCLRRIQSDIEAYGLPALEEGDEVIKHAAMSLCYSEPHEQAKWVVHVITPQIINGNLSRTNDFRKDPMVKTGTAVKKDYWKSGFDRGHLAPSADFRWSKTAMSESYYYSNMSPQRPECNRKSMATLEGKIRAYVEEYNEQLTVVSGGVLRDGLPTIGENEVSIPEWYFKVVLDYSGPEKRAIAFLLPNEFTKYPVWSYAVSVDSAEKVSGLDFFASLDDAEEAALESSFDINDWKIEAEKDEAEPMDPTKLGKGKFNTLQAKYHIGDEITVCGKVVSTKYSAKSGNTYLNLDRKFPNHVFSIKIGKDHRNNFGYKPEDELDGKRICVTGKITSSQGVPSVSIADEQQIEILPD